MLIITAGPVSVARQDPANRRIETLRLDDLIAAPPGRARPADAQARDRDGPLRPDTRIGSIDPQGGMSVGIDGAHGSVRGPGRGMDDAQFRRAVAEAMLLHRAMSELQTGPFAAVSERSAS